MKGLGLGLGGGGGGRERVSPQQDARGGSQPCTHLACPGSWGQGKGIDPYLQGI